MGLYVSTERRVIIRLPDTALSEFSSDLLIIKREPGKYIVLQDFGEVRIKNYEVKRSDGTTATLIGLEYTRKEGSPTKGITGEVSELLMKGAPQFRTGCLPFTRFRIVEEEHDMPAGGDLALPIALVSFGTIRQKRYSYWILADLPGVEAEFDVTDCLQHYLTTELIYTFRKTVEERELLKLPPEERLKIYLWEEKMKLNLQKEQEKQKK